MNILESILLGILQGLTEFLPVSSSGHLALIESMLGHKDVPLFYDILLHVASLIAVLIFFKEKIFKLLKGVASTTIGEQHIYSLMIIISTTVTGLMLFITKPAVEFLRQRPSFLFFTFIFTAFILLIAQYFINKKSDKKKITVADAVIIGLFQGIAVLPGVSRSGSTITAGLMRKISPEDAVEYSFILAIPAILGALLLETVKGSFTAIDPIVAAAGFAASLISSVIALKFLVFMIKKTVLYPFSIYLIILSGFVFFK